jgi:uncharacterized protein (TIGR00162 family)
MEDITIISKKNPKLRNVILIEGLSGIGNVGKLAVEHLIGKLNAVKFADIYSKYFPPQVLLNNECVVKLVNNELYYVKQKNDIKNDLLFLMGDYQGLTLEGQYNLSNRVLDMALNYGVKMIITLGGYGLGRLIDKPRVFGAVGNPKMIPKMKEYGIIFQSGELKSGIIGASGLLLGLGRINKIDGVCLLGETSGYYTDPKSAQEVLKILIKILGIGIDFAELEEKAKQIDKITSRLREIEKPKTKNGVTDLPYIG